jgi:hypothetical protein
MANSVCRRGAVPAGLSHQLFLRATRPPALLDAFCGRVRRLPSDKPGERPALHGSGMILGSGPMSRPSDPAEFGQDCPLPRGGPRGSQERRPCLLRVSEAALTDVLFALAPDLSGIRVAPAKSVKLDVTRPAVAGSLSATDQSVQETYSQPMQPFPSIAWLRMSPKSADEIPR